MAEQALDFRSQAGSSAAAEAQKANEHLYRPGYYQDEEGYRKLMNELGVTVEGGVLREAEPKWTVRQTVLFVLAVSSIGWAGIIAAIAALT